MSFGKAASSWQWHPFTGSIAITVHRWSRGILIGSLIQLFDCFCYLFVTLPNLPAKIRHVRLPFTFNAIASRESYIYYFDIFSLFSHLRIDTKMHTHTLTHTRTLTVENSNCEAPPKALFIFANLCPIDVHIQCFPFNFFNVLALFWSTRTALRSS